MSANKWREPGQRTGCFPPAVGRAGLMCASMGRGTACGKQIGGPKLLEES